MPAHRAGFRAHRRGYWLHQQPALRAIRYADVRYGILPSQSLTPTPTCANLERATAEA